MDGLQRIIRDAEDALDDLFLFGLGLDVCPVEAQVPGVVG